VGVAIGVRKVVVTSIKSNPLHSKKRATSLQKKEMEPQTTNFKNKRR
jgi:hypothetical protein